MTEKFEKSLETVDEQKRDTVRKLVRTAAFSAPVIATFAIDGKLNLANAGVTLPNSTAS
ncbi:hypothetical protein [Anderseniella sp. Alg231-50]|uniref:hypothetical protein n=1 Tax=Anderseniella sp. Alg231-50 TaxID=1922226 RepID=UPI00307C185D